MREVGLHFELKNFQVNTYPVADSPSVCLLSLSSFEWTDNRIEVPGGKMEVCKMFIENFQIINFLPSFHIPLRCTSCALHKHPPNCRESICPTHPHSALNECKCSTQEFQPRNILVISILILTKNGYLENVWHTDVEQIRNEVENIGSHSFYHMPICMHVIRFQFIENISTCSTISALNSITRAFSCASQIFAHSSVK